jgi:hypothetical protein
MVIGFGIVQYLTGLMVSPPFTSSWFFVADDAGISHEN